MDDIVKEALEAFEVAQEAEDENRDDAKDDIEFARLLKQWPENIRARREQENRPCLTFDKLGPVIRQVINDARMNRPATAVRPVDGNADKDTAEILTGLIRNIEAMSDADIAYDTAVEQAVTGGFGYWRINTDYAINAFDEDGITQAGEAAFDKNIFIRAVPNQFSVYGDPHSEKADSSDWMTAFVVDLVTHEQFKAQYPDAEVTDFSGDSWTERQRHWINEDTVQVAEYWKRERQVKNAYAVQLENDVVVMMEDQLKKEQELITQAGGQVIGQPRPVYSYKVTQHMISGAEELSKVEWPGCFIPIVPVYGDEVNLEGIRYFRSLIRNAKDAQRKYNYWSTTMTEMVALAPKVPYIGQKGAFDVDNHKWQTANSESHAYLEYPVNMQAPQRTQPVQVEPGMMQEMLNASDEIKAITGIYDASLGARSNETSGKAIMARQREGDVSTFHFIDNLTRAIRHSGRIIVDLIPKVYSTPRMIRILGEDGSVDEAVINQQFDDGDYTRIHDVRTGRYDVTVKAGPSFTSRREEAATQMMEMVQAFGPELGRAIGDLLAKNLDWPGADEIAKRLQKMLPPELQDDSQDPQVQALQQQIEQMGQALQQLQGALAKAEEEKSMEARKLAIDEYKAVTERMKEGAALVDPAMLQMALQGLSQDLAATEQSMPSAPAAPDFGQAA